MKKTLIAFILLAAAGMASAQSKDSSSNLYGELGYQATELKTDGLADSPKLNVGSAILGYQFHPNLAAELFLATSLSTDTTNGIETKLNNGYGVILRPSYKFNDKFEGFARVGYGRYKLSVNTPFGSGSTTENSFLYCLGGNYYFTNQVYGQLSYTSFFDKDGASVRGFGVSLGYKF